MDAMHQLLLLHGRGLNARSALASRLVATLAEHARVHAFEDVDALVAAAPDVNAPGTVALVIVDPDVPAPFAAARRIARALPGMRFVFAVAPEAEAVLRRESVYAAPPGGLWSLLRADDARLVEQVAMDVRNALQQQRLRTTVDRMKLRLATAAPVDSGEYRRLLASDRYLASVLHHAHDAIVSIDPAGRVVSWNRGAERLFGVAADDARGTDFASLFRDARAARQLIEATLSGASRSAGLEVGTDDDVRHVEANFSVLQDDVRGSFGAVAILRDTTERHRAEEELRENSRQKDEFLAMLAHELRNPLAPIRNATQLLRMLHAADSRAASATAVISRQTDHLAALLDDLLDVARVTRGAVVLERECVDVGGIIGDAVEQARSVIDAKRHRLSIVGATAGVAVPGDRKRLTQVLANLLINAAKYTPEDGAIELSVQADARNVVLSVADTGVGIEPELLHRVFDLFVQAQRSPDRAQGGLGVGLALVKSLVAMHGGSVTASSAGPGRGSTFRVQLPRAQAEDGAPADEEAPQQPRAERPLRLMVVDDNADAAHTLGVLLEAIGHRVDVLTDSRLALERAAASPPDAFILDIGMPHVDGYELARRIRSIHAAHRPVLIALTGYGSPSDRERAQLAGFDHHLVKPVDADVLMRLLHEIGAAAAAH
jgi:PAS domain S-box-containing protein